MAQTKCLSHFQSGLDGSRTRVRNTIPCPSTSVVYSLTFPPPHENKHPCGFSSFMIRPTAQSFADVVSYIVEAWVPKCRCSGSDCCQIRQRMLNYLQRLILIVEFNVSRTTRFSSCMIPVETITSPCYVFAEQKYNSCLPPVFCETPIQDSAL